MTEISPAAFDISQRIAGVLGLPVESVAAAVNLLDDGYGLPFIARYRKEATSGLTEQQLRQIEDHREQLRTLLHQQQAIVERLNKRGLLTPDLRSAIDRCSTLAELDQIYAPFRQTRRTKADVARELGLQPLAERMLQPVAQGERVIDIVRPWLQPGTEISTVPDALASAGHILAETWACRPDVRSAVLQHAKRGHLVAKVRKGKEQEGAPWQSWFDHREPVSRVSSHRFLAMSRGVAKKVLRMSIDWDHERAMKAVKRLVLPSWRTPFYPELQSAAEDCYRRLLRATTETAVLKELRASAEETAIGVFAKNLRDVLMAAPAGAHTTIGLDPGFRTGCKVAVVDEVGRVLATSVIYPTPPRNETEKSEQALLDLVREFQVTLIAIGNGTASRETQAFVNDVVKRHKLHVNVVVVSEAGASVYSASEIAVAEYPDMDVSLRGAVSIAHRLQDPLAELVKIEPASIGVGQYQHDVNAQRLQKVLAREVQSCVSAVGVDVNLASASLLQHVPGLSAGLARRIVQHREKHGPFQTRTELKTVSGLGAKAFEQSAAFLKIRDGREPLDATAVHPENYPAVYAAAKSLKTDMSSVLQNEPLLAELAGQLAAQPDIGALTAEDIVQELRQPGRDPRQSFNSVEFDPTVCEIEDVRSGMTLEGVVTNVTAFGAFVDIGVHQDGLVHISQLTDGYVSDPLQVVHVGQIVRVRVLDVDVDRKRISLSCRDVDSRRTDT